MTQAKFLEIYVIYDRPSDYPFCFVMRLFHNDKPTGLFKCANTLEEIRELVPIGKVRIERHDSDPPSVSEAWI
jgi:hypothetical protein